MEVSLQPVAALAQDLLPPTPCFSTLLPYRPVCDSSVLLCLKKRFYLGRIYVRGTQEGMVGRDSLSSGIIGPSGHPWRAFPSIFLLPGLGAEPSLGSCRAGRGRGHQSSTLFASPAPSMF